VINDCILQDRAQETEIVAPFDKTFFWRRGALSLRQAHSRVPWSLSSVCPRASLCLSIMSAVRLDTVSY
jgi:hypothetical protein